MKLSIKLVFVLAFVALICSANLNAQTPSSQGASTPASGPAASAAPASGSEGPAAAASTLYTVPGIGLPITNSMVCTWIVAAIILVIVRASTWKNIKEIPSGMQNLLEAI
ncbi:MAG TPA: hypothetical protein VNV43_09985, partial [Candidatus Acidoferrales bacterium]|nr:hypothetical protein [Candidatus Acidoferrales bacterium]